MSNNTSQPRQFAIPLEFHWPENVATRFANQFVVQITEGVCYLSFYESVPPILLGTPEEIAAKMEKMSSIRAEGVVRVVIPLAKMPDILNVISTTLGHVPQGAQPGTETKGAPE
jgi:hypothetical protein